MKQAIEIPTDRQLLTQLLLESRAQIAKQQELIENLQHQLSQLQRMLFGKKSEKRNQSKNNEAEPNKENFLINKLTSSPSDQKSPNGRRPLSADLERIKIKHDIPEDKRFCPSCEFKLHCVGKEVSEQLDFIPAKLYVKQHIRYKYGCRCCQKIITAAMPEQPIDKGLAGAGLLADIVISKYQDALPLYRQELRFKRLGYELPRSTLCDWVSQIAFRLKPIVDAMINEALLKSHKLHTDDTPIRVLAKQGKPHTGRLWVYVGGSCAPPCTIYQYSKTRASKVPHSFLKNYRGYLQADAYAGYDKCFENGNIIEVACFAHSRRKFVLVAESIDKPVLANTAIEFIAGLYAIESRAKALSSEQRYYLRKRLAKPILKRFKRWLLIQKKTVPPKSPLGQAMQYTLNHWQALNNYLRNGILSIDNNAAERAIKPVVIGRKNYLFAGSHQGAENAAVIYSLIETCKMNGINTFEYLKDVIAKLPTTLMKNIHELFPYNWRSNLNPI